MTFNYSNQHFSLIHLFLITQINVLVQWTLKSIFLSMCLHHTQIIEIIMFENLKRLTHVQICQGWTCKSTETRQ